MTNTCNAQFSSNNVYSKPYSALNHNRYFEKYTKNYLYSDGKGVELFDKNKVYNKCFEE